MEEDLANEKGENSIDSAIAAKGYAHPEALVSTEWLAQHLNDPGHIPGAQKIDWHEDLNDPVQRDYISEQGFEELLRAKGIDDRTTVIFYGDKNNWWATYAYWVFQLFGFTNARLLDGGRVKWEQEGREMTTEVPVFPATSYKAGPRDDEKIRAFFDQVREHADASKPLVDVRSP